MLQWFRIAKIGQLHVGYQHLFGIALIIFSPLIISKVPKNNETIILVFVGFLYIVFGMGPTLFLDIPFYSLSAVIRQVVYFLISVVIIIFIASAKDELLKKLSYLGPMSAGVFLIGFSYSLGKTNVDIISTIATALTTANPNILIFRMFGVVMSTEQGGVIEDVQANLRHGISEAILVSSVISFAYAKTFIVNRRHLFFINAGIFFNVLILMLCLSRSVLLASFFCFFILYFHTSSYSKNHNFLYKYAIYCLIPMGVAAFLMTSGVWDIIANRFFSTEQSGSYLARFDILRQTFKHIGTSVLIPSSIQSLNISSPHNIMLSNWLASGLLGFLISIIFFATIGIAMAVRILNIFKTKPNAMQAAYVGSIALLSLPLIRAITAGAGLSASSWAAIGLGFGIIARHQKRKYQINSHH